MTMEIDCSGTATCQGPLEPPEPPRGSKNSPLEPLEGQRPFQLLGFGLWTPELSEYISTVLRPLTCGALLKQTQETNTGRLLLNSQGSPAGLQLPYCPEYFSGSPRVSMLGIPGRQQRPWGGGSGLSG